MEMELMGCCTAGLPGINKAVGSRQSSADVCSHVRVTPELFSGGNVSDGKTTGKSELIQKINLLLFQLLCIFPSQSLGKPFPGSLSPEAFPQ